MENKKAAPATQQPMTQQHLMAHHVHPGEQIYSHQHPQLTQVTSPQPGQLQPNGVMHQLLQGQYHSNIDARSPLLENRHELYGTGHNHDYARHYGTNENYNYPQSPQRPERQDQHTDQNVNHELLQNMPKGYNAEVYQDYLKRNPPKDTNQIYQNHQPMYRPNANQYGSKPYLPYSSRTGPQSNTELLRRQYNEIQQMKLQQQMLYQNQAQMHQQQKFAERQILLQQIHGVQPPPNLQNSIYSDGSYRDLDRYSSKLDFKDYSPSDIQKDVDQYAKNNEFKNVEKYSRQSQPDAQWQTNQTEYNEPERFRRQSESDKGKSQSQSPPSDYNHINNVGVISPMKSSESSSASVKSPSSESRRSSAGNQALRSPIAQRIPSAPVTMAGILYKQGSDGLKVWRKRWFVLSEYCLFYYKNQDEEKTLGSVLLPSYRVSACTQEDKVLRKFAFKLEHANMRTYILAAPDQESMLKWVKALTMAALMQTSSEQTQKPERAAAKTEDDDEAPGPTYANAPPKPRRSNEGYYSPSPEYDPNYDLLKKPASHYSQGTSQTRQDLTYPTRQDPDNIYARSQQQPALPTTIQHQHQVQYQLQQQQLQRQKQQMQLEQQQLLQQKQQIEQQQQSLQQQQSSHQPQQPLQYQPKRPYDTHNLSLPLTNTVTERLENNQPGTSAMNRSNPQSPYFDHRTRHQQKYREKAPEQIYDKQQRAANPFLQDITPQETLSPVVNDSDVQMRNYMAALEQERKSVNTEMSPETPLDSSSAYNRDIYGEANTKPSRVNANAVNDRLLIERRTPDAYGRSTAMSSYNRSKMGDYEDVYMYGTENEYGRANSKPISSPQNPMVTGPMQTQEPPSANYAQEKTFNGPSVLRRKKMQSNNIQPSVPRPHSADFLEYESKNEMLNKTMPSRSMNNAPKQPQRPKSSLDINSFYDPSSDRYYSEESYAEKMRQSAQYLHQQQAMGPKNIQIPLEKYASGLAEKQLHSPYSQNINNNYETEFGTTRNNRDNISYTSKYSDLEGLMNSNWTLKEKEVANQKEFLNRSGSVLSDGSNLSGYAKNMNRFDPAVDSFMRSASARLPSTNTGEKEGEKKVQQREESMKRLLEWKQRMLQSPLTRKSTPATISLARSLNQSRQSLRSDQYKPKTYGNATYNSYSSDDEASMTIPAANHETNINNTTNQQALSKKAFLGSNTSIGRSNRENNIPVRAVSPRVRWVEDKSSNDHYGSQQMSMSQQNLHALNSEDSWAVTRSPSRASAQPIRAVSPRLRQNIDHCDIPAFQDASQAPGQSEIPTAGELLGRTHEELVLLLIQLRRRHAATHRAIEQCVAQMRSIEESITQSTKALEREESLQRLDKLKIQLMELEHQYQKSKPLVQLVDNMVKLGSLYNRPGSTMERLERNQRLRHKVLAEHALEQERWLESAAAGKPLETEAARARVAELWALEQELADEACILKGLKTDKDAIESLLCGVRSKFSGIPVMEPQRGEGLEEELARVHAMLALNSKKLEQTVADNARLERELTALRRALHAQRQGATPAHLPQPATAMLEDEVSRVQQLVSSLQRQRKELSHAVRTLTHQSRALQATHTTIPGSKQQQQLNPQHRSTQQPMQQYPMSSWQETNLDTGHTTDHGHLEYEYDVNGGLYPPGNYDPNVEMPLYVDTRGSADVNSPITSEELHQNGFANLSNVEKQEIKTVRIVKRESERRQRDRERSLQPMSDWPSNNVNANLEQFLEEELMQTIQPTNYARASSVPRTDFSKFEEYYSKPQEPPNYLKLNTTMSMELSPKFPSSPSLSNLDYSRDISSLSNSYNKNYDRSGYDRTISISTQYLNSPTDSARTLTNDPMTLSKTSSINSFSRSHMELSPIFKSEAAKQIMSEMSGDAPKNGSLHRRQVPKEKRRHYTAPHHLSAKTLNELPTDVFNQDKLGRSLDDADMERALRAPPDVVRSALAPQPQRYAENTIDQLLAAPQKILIPERYVPEKPPELSPEEQQKRQEKVESIKKMLSSSSADPNKSPDGEEKKQRAHLLQMNQILAKQVTEMSKIIAGTNTDQGPSTGN